MCLHVIQMHYYCFILAGGTTITVANADVCNNVNGTARQDGTIVAHSKLLLA